LLHQVEVVLVKDLTVAQWSCLGLLPGNMFPHLVRVGRALRLAVQAHIAFAFSYCSDSSSYSSKVLTSELGLFSPKLVIYWRHEHRARGLQSCVLRSLDIVRQVLIHSAYLKTAVCFSLRPFSLSHRFLFVRENILILSGRRFIIIVATISVAIRAPKGEVHFAN
jgi:hypothetical protein